MHHTHDPHDSNHRAPQAQAWHIIAFIVFIFLITVMSDYLFAKEKLSDWMLERKNAEAFTAP